MSDAFLFILLWLIIFLLGVVIYLYNCNYILFYNFFFKNILIILFTILVIFLNKYFFYYYFWNIIIFYNTSGLFFNYIFTFDLINVLLYSRNVCVVSLVYIFFICICSICYYPHFSNKDTLIYIIHLSTIFIGGVLFISLNNLILVFFSYELFLIPTCIIIARFSKTNQGRSSIKFMVLFTQIGAVLLFFVLYYFCNIYQIIDFSIINQNFSKMWINLLTFLVFFAFATKIPLWPFYWWLPQAHVEVTTSFSIVLSGVSIKFAFFGFLRFMSYLSYNTIFYFFLVICVIGLIDSLYKIETEVDIKKIVAYTTVLEMHAFTFFIFLDYNIFISFIYYSLVIHGWLSTLQFILVDIIARRYNSRNLENLYGVAAESPLIVKIIFYTVFCLNGIPGSSVFLIEFYLIIFGSTNFFTIVSFMVIYFLLMCFSKLTWFNLTNSDSSSIGTHTFNLTNGEIYFILFLFLQLFPCFFGLNFFYL